MDAGQSWEGFARFKALDLQNICCTLVPGLLMPRSRKEQLPPTPLTLTCNSFCFSRSPDHVMAITEHQCSSLQH